MKNVDMDSIAFELRGIEAAMSAIIELLEEDLAPEESGSHDEQIRAVLFYRRACKMYKPALSYIFCSISDLLEDVEKASGEK